MEAFDCFPAAAFAFLQCHIYQEDLLLYTSWYSLRLLVQQMPH